MDSDTPENALPVTQAKSAENVGHGHVYIRPDGVRARCGGPSICSKCALDLSRLQHRLASEQSTTAATGASGELVAAATNLLADVRRRYPGEELRWLLREAKLQLEYMDERSPSGTTPAIIARIDATLGAKP